MAGTRKKAGILAGQGDLFEKVLPAGLEVIARKSNAIVRGGFSAPLDNVFVERLVNCLATKIKPTDTEFRKCTVHISELLPDREADGGKTRKLIRRGLEFLQVTRYIYEDKKYRVSAMIFASDYVYEKETGFYNIEFHKDVKKFLLNLKEHYTDIPYREFVKLSSTYSQLFYQYLKSWESVKHEWGYRDVSIDELVDLLQLGEVYRNFGNLRQRILCPAEKEIKEKTGLYFEWYPLAKGRKYTGIRIIFDKKKINQIKKINDSVVSKEWSAHMAAKIRIDGKDDRDAFEEKYSKEKNKRIAKYNGEKGRKQTVKEIASMDGGLFDSRKNPV